MCVCVCVCVCVSDYVCLCSSIGSSMSATPSAYQKGHIMDTAFERIHLPHESNYLVSAVFLV